MHQFQQQLEQDMELTCHRHRRYLLTYRRRNYVLFYLESQLYHQSCTHIHGHHIPMEVNIVNLIGCTRCVLWTSFNSISWITKVRYYIPHTLDVLVKQYYYHLFLLHVYKTCFLSLYLKTDYSLSITFPLC